MAFPRMVRVRQHFDSPRLDDIAGIIHRELRKLSLSDRVKAGDSIAITVGSRGIANIALIIKTLVEELKELGAVPFIVPAMGSYGGGTAEGQRAIVEGYGVTESFTGAPIRATMDVVQVGETDDGIPVFFDRYAYEADHVVVVGRVRPHTDFTGEIESGLMKMMLIGLGKHHGARIYHQAIVRYSFDRIIRSVGQMIIDRCGIRLGLAVLENGYHETALIRALLPETFLDQEKKLLTLARRWMPRLPFQQVDLLIVDQMGKNISGTGMDTTIIGRKRFVHCAASDEFPKITRIYVRDLSEESHGNATGIGYAEYTHAQLVGKIDCEKTYINCMTGNRPDSAAIPIHYATDKKVLDAALKTIGYVAPEDARVIRIRNTLDLGEILVSDVYQTEMAIRTDLKAMDGARETAFDDRDNLLPF
jgi:hypothetical protein